jgi:hypothetical protein
MTRGQFSFGGELWNFGVRPRESPDFIGVCGGGWLVLTVENV